MPGRHSVISPQGRHGCADVRVPDITPGVSMARKVLATDASQAAFRFSYMTRLHILFIFYISHKCTQAATYLSLHGI